MAIVKLIRELIGEIKLLRLEISESNRYNRRYMDYVHPHMVVLTDSINKLNETLITKGISPTKANERAADTSDIFRIKEGPKKGLLSYKKARE